MDSHPCLQCPKELSHLPKVWCICNPRNYDKFMGDYCSSKCAYDYLMDRTGGQYPVDEIDNVNYRPHGVRARKRRSRTRMTDKLAISMNW